jgi:hypothetical protein
VEAVEGRVVDAGGATVKGTWGELQAGDTLWVKASDAVPFPYQVTRVGEPAADGRIPVWVARHGDDRDDVPLREQPDAPLWRPEEPDG